MSTSKQKRLINELYCLFIATAFLKIYLDETKSESLELINLHKTLTKKSLEYSKYIKPLTTKASEIFNECERDLVDSINEKKRFSKKIVLNENKDLEVHGLVFIASIVMEQEQLKDRILNLPYAVARKILIHFAHSSDEVVLNSQILSGYFIRKITK